MRTLFCFLASLLTLLTFGCCGDETLKEDSVMHGRRYWTTSRGDGFSRVPLFPPYELSLDTRHGDGPPPGGWQIKWLSGKATRIDPLLLEYTPQSIDRIERLWVDKDKGVVYCIGKYHSFFLFKDDERTTNSLRTDYVGSTVAYDYTVYILQSRRRFAAACRQLGLDYGLMLPPEEVHRLFEKDPHLPRKLKQIPWIPREYSDSERLDITNVLFD